MVEKINETLITEKVAETPVVEGDLSINGKEKEYIERLQRLQAEFENFKKRTDKEKLEYSMNANSNLIFQLLNILDGFELSLKHNKDVGVKLIYEELNKILEKQGLKVVDAKGDFNPKMHEAIIKVEGEKEGIILEEIQKGYLLNNKLLRASKVKVSTLMEKK